MVATRRRLPPGALCVRPARTAPRPRSTPLPVPAVPSAPLAQSTACKTHVQVALTVAMYRSPTLQSAPLAPSVSACTVKRFGFEAFVHTRANHGFFFPPLFQRLLNPPPQCFFLCVCLCACLFWEPQVIIVPMGTTPTRASAHCHAPGERTIRTRAPGLRWTASHAPLAGPALALGATTRLHAKKGTTVPAAPCRARSTRAHPAHSQAARP